MCVCRVVEDDDMFLVVWFVGGGRCSMGGVGVGGGGVEPVS